MSSSFSDFYANHHGSEQVRPSALGYVPMVVETTAQGERGYDLYSRMMRDRIVFINGPINHHTANILVTQLLFLESEGATKDISIYINSPGGSVYAGMAIYDTMQYIKPAIRTYCIGIAASMAAFLLAAGEKGKRVSLPHSRIMIHQPSGGFTGQASDVKIHASEILRIREETDSLLAHHTGQTVEDVRRDTERDFFMSPTEAQAYGIIDIISMRK